MLETQKFQINIATFLNAGNAKTLDIENLINKVKKEVKSKTGINLELEIKIIGNENNYDELDSKVPLVSILLNCYNASSFISKAIESVLGQTYHNWELVIWDDGSTDNTLQVINNYKDKRIKIFKSLNNIGLGKSRLKAISKLNGKLISILDADDYFEPEKIKKQVDIFNNYPDVSICATWANFYNELNKIIYSFKTRNKEEELKKKLLYINFLPHSSIMYRKKSLRCWMVLNSIRIFSRL